MELKRLITHFTYRIEPKPGGGFVAHASDPTLPPLEAGTREELQHAIQANIAAAVAAEFPGLKLPGESQELKFDFRSKQSAMQRSRAASRKNSPAFWESTLRQSFLRHSPHRAIPEMSR
jgi:hypothetical protein